MNQLRDSSAELAMDFARNYIPIDFPAMEAEREFRRSRRKAFRRLLRTRLTGRGPMPGREGPTSANFELMMDEIAGLSEAGMGLPPLPKKLIGVWRVEYQKDEDPGLEAPFELRWEEGGWRLTGGFKALIRLELLRAKGRDRIAARSLPLDRTGSPSLVVRPTSYCLDCPDRAAS